MIYGLVLGDHTIHIKSDVIPRKSNSKDDKDDDDSDDDDDDSDDEDDDSDDNNDWPAEIEEILSDDRGPLYHCTCNKELLHPKDTGLYRIRSLEANGSKVSRVQSDIVVKDFKHVKCPRPLDPNLEYQDIGSLEEEDKPAAQVKLAFLRVNKQVYEEASTILYSTRTFGFDDSTTFAQFFSINYQPVAQPPTPTHGTSLLATKRNSITSVHIRAKTALCLAQKIQWMNPLDAATFVLPGLKEIRVLFDLCHEGKEGQVERTPWQYWRHRNAVRLLETAEVRVATHFYPFPTDKTEYEDIWEFRDCRWRWQFLEAVLGFHMDVLFGASLLDPASVAERDATFAGDCLDLS